MIWIVATLLMLAAIWFIVGVFLAIHFENVVIFLIFAFKAYVVFFLVLLANFADWGLFWALDVLPMLCVFFIPPGIVLFLVGCCIEEHTQRIVYFGGTALSFGASLMFFMMYLSALRSI